jgi:uncharacterized iron-regulated protein
LLAGCAHRGEPSADDLRRLVAAMASQPIVLLGEVHDNALQHGLRLQALRGHLAAGRRPALVMEQFDRERQADIDRAVAGANPSADAVIEAGAPGAAAQRGWDWRLYRPYIALALEHGLPIVAANVSRADARRAVQDGLASLGFDPTVPPDVASAQAQEIADSHCGAIDAAQARGLVASQVARDQFMARAVQAHAARGAVLLAGNGHVRRDIGVPRWLEPGWRERSVAIGLLEEGNPGGAAFDFALVTPAQPRGDPCATMRRPAPVPG